jgi:hypothetical protein
MPDVRRQILILNCEGTRRRVERRQEAAVHEERTPAPQMPVILPFTFNRDLLADAGLESGVVLRPHVGVKS